MTDLRKSGFEGANCAAYATKLLVHEMYNIISDTPRLAAGGFVVACGWLLWTLYCGPRWASELEADSHPSLGFVSCLGRREIPLTIEFPAFCHPVLDLGLFSAVSQSVRAKADHYLRINTDFLQIVDLNLCPPDPGSPARFAPQSAQMSSDKPSRIAKKLPPSNPAPPGDHRKRRRNRTTQSCLNCHASKRMVPCIVTLRRNHELITPNSVTARDLLASGVQLWVW